MKKTDPVRPTICLVSATPLAIHFFLKMHVRQLANFADVTIITNLDSDQHTPVLDLPVRLISIGIKRDIALLADIKALFQLIRLLYIGKYDLVWGIGPKAGLLSMVAATLIRAKIRLFIFQGEVWASKSGFKRWLIKTMDRITARTATHLLAVSHSERRFLIEQGVACESKIGVLGEGSIGGVDTGKYRPDTTVRDDIRLQLGIPSSATLALFLGRLNTDKGIIDLITAFNLARKNCPDLWLLIVGPDESGMTSRIQDLLGVETKHCRMVGFTENPELYFSSADFLCLPSYREGFPVSILEAAAAGIPTIGSRIYGISDAIVDGETGLLFEVRNVSALAEAISTLSNNAALRIKLGITAQNRVRKSFDQNEVIHSYVKYVQDCLDNSY